MSKMKKGFLMLIVGGVMLMSCQSMASEDCQNWDNVFLVGDGNPLISAHRAGKSVAPENTLMAVETSISATGYKVDMLEFDLHITKDKELILLHDRSMDRTSNAVEHFGKTKNIPSELTYAQLRELNMAENFKNSKGEYPYRGLRGEDISDNIKVSSLRSVLTFLLEKDSNGEALYDGSFIIEIKNAGDLGCEAAAELNRILNDFDIKDRAIIATFNKEVTKYFDKHMSDITRSASYKEVVSFILASTFKTPLRNVAYKVLQIPMREKFLGIKIDLSSKNVVDYAHKFGIAIQYWTINNAEDMAYLKEVGADGIITDAPDLCYEVLH